MGKFLPVCPKCTSTDTDLYQDRTVSARSFPHCAVFHCRCCGNRLMGAPAVDYTNRLMGEHLAAEKATAEKRLRRLEAERALRLEEVHRAKEARAKVKAKAKAKATQRRKVLPFPGTAPAVCAWDVCGEPSRSTSIYCSRNCSNKNARARHRARLEGSEAG